MGPGQEAALVNPKHPEQHSATDRRLALWLCARVARTAKSAGAALCKWRTQQQKTRSAQLSGGKRDVLYWKVAAAEGRLADTQTASGRSNKKSSKHGAGVSAAHCAQLPAPG
jgi:hypothetical protein